MQTKNDYLAVPFGSQNTKYNKMKLEDIFEEEKSKQSADYSKIIYLIYRKWHWFLIFGILGLSGAYVYNKLNTSQFKVRTSILIPETQGTIDMRNLFAGALPNLPKNNIYNQIEIITSYYNINNALLNLEWRTSVFKKDFPTWSGIYKNEPFYVRETDNFMNPGGLEIYITPRSENLYTIKIDGQITVDNVTSDIEYYGMGEFGKPLQNENISFTLFKNPNINIVPDEQYYFVFNDQNEATLSYQKRLNAALKDRKSDIIECSIEGEDPVREGEFLNELINVYTANKIKIYNEAHLRSLEFINRQLAGISDSMNSAGKRFTSFRSENKIIDLGTEGTLIMNNLKELESQKAQCQIQLEYFRDLLSYLNSKEDFNKMVSPSVVSIQDPSLNSLVLRLGELYNRRQVLSFSAKASNVTMMQLDKEIALIRDQLNENLKNLIATAEKSVNSINERIAGINSNLNMLPQKEQQMVNIQRQFNLTSEIYNFLLQKRAETNIALASKIPDIQVIDVARPETAIPVGLSNKTILILGFLLGLTIPFGLIQMINIFSVHIQSQEDIENNTSLSIFGNIIHNTSGSELAVHNNPNTIIAESFRELRANLQFMVNNSTSRIISIHSLYPNEGKTFIAMNLAIVLAMNDQRVLLIDADLRKPKIHKMLSLPNDQGLSTYLNGKNKIEEVISNTLMDKLLVLTSGPVPPNPGEILGKQEMNSMLNQVRTLFDYIIIDNTPMGLVIDGVVISHLSDLNLFVLRYGVSHKNQVKTLDHLASSQRIGHMAIVVNDIKNSAFRYSYYKDDRYEAYKESSNTPGKMKYRAIKRIIKKKLKIYEIINSLIF